MNIGWIILLALLLMPNSGLYSQSYSLHQYTTEDGLPSSTIYSVDQDSEGVLWFGTENGLSAFDGVKFENYTIQDGLLGSTVYGVTIDYLDRKWLSTLGHNISVFNDSRVEEADWLTDVSIRVSLINYVEKDSSLYFFVSTTESLLYWVTKKCYAISPILLSPREIEVDLAGTSRLMFEWDGDWLSPSGECKFLVFNSGNLVDSIDMAEFGIGQCKKCVSWDENVVCFIRSESEHSKIIEIRSLNFENTTSKEILTDLKDYLYLNRENHFMVDSNGDFWISTFNDLILIKEPLSLSPKLEFVIRGKSVNFSFEDHEGNIWVGTEGQGLFQISNTEVTNISAEDNLMGASITVFKADENGNLWLGYSNGCVEVLDSEFESILQKKLSGSRIRDIQFDSCLTYVITDSEVYSNDCSEGFRFLTPGIAFKSSLLVNKELFLFSYIIQKLKFDELEKLEFDQKDRIYTAFLISDSIIWLGGSSGLYRYNIKRQENLGIVHPELNIEVGALQEMPDGTFWLATKGKGIFEFKEDSILRQFSVENGLSSNLCSDLLLVDSILWVTTNNGINKINIHTTDIQFLNKKDGLINIEFLSIELIEDKIIASGEKGLDVISLTSKSFNDPPGITVRAITLNGELTDSLKSNYAYFENNFQLEFQVISYKSQGDLSFSYRINSESLDWNEVNSSAINFNALSPGQYKVEFRARGKSTNWGYYPPIEFEIFPPWWRSWWFLTFLGLFLLSVILLIFRSVLTRQESRNKIEQQLKELELTALRAQMNPHFLFNALNSINWFVNRNDPDSANLYMAKFALLIRKILANSGESQISLSEEIEQLELYLELENLRMDNTMDYSITVADDIDTGWILVPGMLIQPYVENAILHGLVPQEGERKLELSFTLNAEAHLKCEILDSGIGIETSRKLKEKKSNGEPHGMDLTQKRLQLINKDRIDNVFLSADELYDSTTNKILGTKIVLVIPIQYDAN